jgi:glucosamine kinase
MIPPQPLYLGIDGGGTVTTAWVADRRGRARERGAAGPSNPVKVGLPAAKRELLAAARQALEDSPRAELRSVCVGLAGGDRPEVSRPILTWLRKQFPARTHLLTTDAAVTLTAALGSAPGMVVIAGTGSIACGRNRAGRMLRAGGWGSAFGDEGSAFDMGRKAVQSALKALDGRGPRTSLARLICGSLGLAEISQIVGLNLKPQQTAALAPLVIEAARKGDGPARQIVDKSAQDLAQLAAALLRRLGLREGRVPVVLAGGLLRGSVALRRRFRRHLGKLAPEATVSVLRREPVEGALELAMRADPSQSSPSQRKPRRR